MKVQVILLCFTTANATISRTTSAQTASSIEPIRM